MILSIGMIVKNEEKYLGKCLSALKPVLDAVDSELIIADTGSSDNTVNIAKQYTNNVFHFEWCNDYSKARNATLKYSKGEWYMFLDADEILQNPKVLINFFNSGEYKKYDYISVIQRNLSSENIYEFSDIYISRMAKRTPELIFQNSVHESLCNKGLKSKSINIVLLHYGYIQGRHLAKKADKYINYLIEELKNAPYDIRQINQLNNAYRTVSLYYQSIDIMKRALKLLNQNDIYYNVSFFYLAFSYMRAKDYFTFLNILDKYFIQFKMSNIIDMYIMILNIHFNIRNYKAYINYFKAYEKIYKDITVKNIIFEESHFLSLNTSPLHYYNNLIALAYSHIKSGQASEAEYVLNKLYKNCMVKQNINISLIVISNILLYSLAPSKHNITNMLNYIYRQSCWKTMHNVLMAFMLHPSKGNSKADVINIMKIISNITNKNTSEQLPFVTFYKLIYLDYTNYDGAKKYLNTHCLSILNIFDETLYYILKYNIPITGKVKRYICTSTKRSPYFYLYSNSFDMLKKAVLSADDIHVKISLIERLVFNKDFQLKNISYIMEIYYSVVSDYISAVFNAEFTPNINNLYLLNNNMRFRLAYKLLYEACKASDKDDYDKLKSILNNIENISFEYLYKYFE